jgi:hypothetical protein
LEISVWEDTHTVVDLWEIEKEILNHEVFRVGDIFDLGKDYKGNFELVDNRPLSI